MVDAWHHISESGCMGIQRPPPLDVFPSFTWFFITNILFWKKVSSDLLHFKERLFPTGIEK